MRTALSTCALLLSLCACTSAPTAKAPTTKERLADALIAIVPPSQMFADLADPHAAQFGTGQRSDKAHANFMRNVDAAALDAVVREALVRRFTEDDLRALVAFCSTPEGRSCLTKVAPFACEVVPACLHEASRAYGKTAVDAARGLLLP